MINTIDEYIKGWLVGDFKPALIESKDIEVGLKYYKRGNYEASHVHNIVTEYTIIVKGVVEMNDHMYSTGKIVKIEPGMSTDFRCLSDEAITLVIKTPSIPSDKHFIK